jgi:hypothetical protein
MYVIYLFIYLFIYLLFFDITRYLSGLPTLNILGEAPRYSKKMFPKEMGHFFVPKEMLQR